MSHTTRAPRPGEVDGVHYHFVAKKDMEAAISRYEFIEHALVHTNFYGTSIAAVEQVRSKGKICILDIDVQGVQSVKKSSLDCRCTEKDNTLLYNIILRDNTLFYCIGIYLFFPLH